ncbi:unnamed protein product [Effrenium voratum]|nr:unnamed protein product [Effrenium voratum]
MLQEAQAKFVEVQTATVDEQQKLVKEAELQRASAAQRCQQAELEKTKLQELQLAAQQKAQQLEQQRCASQAAQQAAEAQLAVQTAALQRTSHFNVELRADCAKLGAETAEAQKAAASAAEAQRKAQQQLAHCQEELKAAKDIAEKELQSAQAAGRKAEQELLAARTEILQRHRMRRRASARAVHSCDWRRPRSPWSSRRRPSWRNGFSKPLAKPRRLQPAWGLWRPSARSSSTHCEAARPNSPTSLRGWRSSKTAI